MDNTGEDIPGRNGKTNPVNPDDKDGNCLGNNGYQNVRENVDEGDALGNTRSYYGQVIAKMPVAKTASHYNMNHKYRGKAVIFNHEVFEVANLKSRAGTEADCKNLTATLKGLGFDVHVFQDLKYQQIENEIKNIAAMDHSDSDCLIVAVLSHGDTGIVYARDTPYKPDNIFERFTATRCITLVGKPKIFFVQACQGDKLDSGVTMVSRTETDGQTFNNYRIPNQADFLIVHATAKGYYAWRNTTRGSWFIQALCEELKEKAFTQDLVTILTFVSQKVAIDYESNTPDNPSMHQQKQIPCILSRLTRLIQFNNNNNVGLEANAHESEQSKGSRFIKFFHSKDK